MIGRLLEAMIVVLALGLGLSMCASEGPTALEAR
jgi:hypothetical protein